MPENESVKCLVIGDSFVGKTNIIKRYIGHWEHWIPTPPFFSSRPCGKPEARLTVDGRNVSLYLWEMFAYGQDEYIRVRELFYPGTDIVVLCFSLVDPESYCNLAGKWYREVRRYCPHTPILLVGTKMDLRHDISVEGRHRRLNVWMTLLHH